MSMRHEALLFAGDDELVAGTHDLIAQGLLAGDLVLVHADPHGMALLRDVWEDDPRISFLRQEELYATPMRTLATFQRMLEHEAVSGHGLRVTGPVPFGEAPRTRRAWMIYEALVDRALAPYEFLSLCQYDTRTLTPDLFALARATHDRVITSSGVEAGGDRRAELLAALAAADGPGALEDEPVVYTAELHDVADLARLRAGLEGAPKDLVFAANEVATNAFLHGRPPISVRLHRGADGWLCVITDRGPSHIDSFAGIDSPLPGNPSPGGRGLWLARQLCDHLTITPDPAGLGTTIRLEHHG